MQMSGRYDLVRPLVRVAPRRRGWRANVRAVGRNSPRRRRRRAAPRQTASKTAAVGPGRGGFRTPRVSSTTCARGSVPFENVVNHVRGRFDTRLAGRRRPARGSGTLRGARRGGRAASAISVRPAAGRGRPTLVRRGARRHDDEDGDRSQPRAGVALRRGFLVRCTVRARWLSGR